jgi:hypothetical protein
VCDRFDVRSLESILVHLYILWSIYFELVDGVEELAGLTVDLSADEGKRKVTRAQAPCFRVVAEYRKLPVLICLLLRIVISAPKVGMCDCDTLDPDVTKGILVDSVPQFGRQFREEG